VSDSNPVWEAFESVEIRVGTVREAHPFPEARTPAIKLHIDFGAGDERWSSAQITERYTPEALVGRQVLAVTNLPPKRVAGFKSECLTLGVAAADGAVVLVSPDEPVADGARLF
jgi:tRNA-binding protein